MKTIHCKVLAFSLSCCFASLSINAQECLWASQAGGVDQDGIDHVITDHLGNVYASGGFRSLSCSFKTTTLHSHGYNDNFIVKYNPSGIELWIRQFGLHTNYLEDKETISGMVFDSLDKTLLVTGSFYNWLILPDTIIQGDGLDIFVLKMDLDGNVIWARTAGGEYQDLGMGITYDNEENVYISGANSHPATFEATIIPQGGFIAKYDKNGNLMWAQNKFRYHEYLPSPVYTEGPPLYLNYFDQQLLVYGSIINDSLVVDTITLGGVWGGNNSYVASFNPDGYVQWLTKVGGSPFQSTSRGQVSLDMAGNLYLTGVFKVIGVFGSDTLTTPGNDIYDFFLTKISPDGSFQWAKQGHSTEEALGQVTQCDNSGNVYSSGIFSDSIFFGGETLVSQSPYDMFIVSFTTEGIVRGIIKYSDGVITGITFDLNGNLVFGGDFAGTLTIGPTVIASNGMYDSFVANCSPISSTKETTGTPAPTLLIYANPTTGKCTITIPEEFRYEEELTLYVYDSQGRLIQKAPIQRTSETYRLDIQAQASGVYQAVLTDGRRSVSGRIVFNK